MPLTHFPSMVTCVATIKYHKQKKKRKKNLLQLIKFYFNNFKETIY